MSRLEFTAKTKRQAYERSGGICECHLIPWLNRPKGCGASLRATVYYEHVIPDGIAKNNDLENCAALCLTCWREKTDAYDRKVISKSNHTRDRARGIKRRKGRPLPGTRASGIRKRMDGTVEKW